jgi:hypothetical protein
MKTRFAAFLAGLLIAGAGSLASTPPASAASGDKGFVYAGTSVYRCNWQGCGVAWGTSYDAWLPFACWADSPQAPYERFFRLTGNTGWIRTVQVPNQPSLPHC